MVHFLIFPVRYRGFWVDFQAALLILVSQSKNVSAERRFRRRREGSAGRAGEFGCAVGLHGNAESAFVYQAMVMAAEQDEVVHLRFAAIRPVHDVVCIHKSMRGAAGKPAAAVAALQGAPDCRWNTARLAPNVEYLAVFVLVPVDDATVAGQTAGRFRGKCARQSLEEEDI